MKLKSISILLSLASAMAFHGQANAAGGGGTISRQVTKSFAESGPQRSVLKPTFNQASYSRPATFNYYAAKGSTSAKGGGGSAGSSGAMSSPPTAPGLSR